MKFGISEFNNLVYNVYGLHIESILQEKSMHLKADLENCSEEYLRQLLAQIGRNGESAHSESARQRIEEVLSRRANTELLSTAE